LLPLAPVTFLPKSRNSPTDRADALSRGNFFMLAQSDSRVSLFMDSSHSF
jgi:hypothetical protein